MQLLAGTLFGVMGAAARLGRSTIIIIGSVIHLAVYIAVSVSFPREAPLRYTDESGFIEPRYVIDYPNNEGYAVSC